jgi:uncharacterized coiled-coil protein SlyX
MVTYREKGRNPNMSQYKTTALIAIACLGILPAAKAVTPAPDGGYANENTAEGTSALFSLTTGFGNTGLGFQALASDTTGGGNTAIGGRTLRFNTASNNTAIGWQSLYKNTTGYGNTAVGTSALELNTTGGYNNAHGLQALFHNASGSYNNAHGYAALYYNTTGSGNDAFGTFALYSNTTSCCNDAYGDNALAQSTGTNNTAIGDFAGITLGRGDGNVYVGAGVFGVNGESNTTRIRNIGTTAIVGGTTVVIDGTGSVGDGRLGVASSSRRFKRDIQPMGESSETLFELKPVTFRPKDDITPDRLKLYGLIAEDVEKVNPDLVTYNQRGEVTTVRFEAVNAMLLNEFLKEHRKVEEQGKTIAELRSTIAQQQKGMEALAAQVKEQSAQIQRVSAELATTEARPQFAENR